MLVLPLMLGVGMPPSVANGTLRVGVLAQSLAAVVTFHRRGERPYGMVARFAVPILVGGAAGTSLATTLDDALLLPIIGALLALWAVVLLLRPGRFLEAEGEPRDPTPWTLLAAVGVGFYGGFLQVAVGFPLLALLTLGAGLPAVQANVVKVGLVIVYTAVALPMFAVAGQVAWAEGVALAVGSLFGGWIGARWQLRAGAGVVRWFVVVTATVSGVAMLWRSFG